ncbi:hypothetical protein GEV33_010045 [Tenebrio molitor]|uniref:Uncharacterized protein n=1 Tax=Tenebrio molitor TaxID=7067 RepID=A0A8J6HE20_TENMO|nr:hypothetical protein GEV33_010045 [Tenebrio molitor]
MVGGVATEVVDASYHLREKSVVEVGVVGDLVDLFKGFGEAICFFNGGVYDCVVPSEVVDSGGFLSCQSLDLSPELLPVPVVEESTRVDPLLLTETVQAGLNLLSAIVQRDGRTTSGKRSPYGRLAGLQLPRISPDRAGIFHDLLPGVLSVPGESQGDSDRVNLQGRRDDVVEFTRAVGDDSSKYHRPHREADHGLHYGRFQTERFCGSGSRRVLSVQVVPGLTGRCRIYPPASQEQW